jgi:hypothetical protein
MAKSIAAIVAVAILGFVITTIAAIVAVAIPGFVIETIAVNQANYCGRFAYNEGPPRCEVP